MTEPTKSRLEEAHKFAINYGVDHGDYYAFQGGDIVDLIAHVRREARNAALDKAAKVFRDCNLWDIPTGVAEEMVLALKDQP